MGWLSNRSQLIAGTAVAAAIFVLGAYLPQSRRLRALRSAVAAVQARVEDRAGRLAQCGARHDDLAQARVRLAGFEEAVPESENLGDLLADISRLAADLHLSEQNVTPSAAVPFGEVSCLPLEVRMHGSFAALFEFIRRIESLPRLARVERASLRAAADGAAALECSLTLLVFFHPDPGAPGLQEAANGIQG